jgi:hypothetical protein
MYKYNNPRPKEGNEWNGRMGKKGKRDNNDYHRAEWKRDMVEEEGLSRVVGRSVIREEAPG